MDTTITPVPTALTTVQPDIAPPVTSVVNSSSHQSSCTLVSVITSPETCPQLQPGADISTSLATEVTSALFDDTLDTCMRPFRYYSTLHLTMDMQCMQGSLIRIQVTGDGPDCLQPSTLLYTDLSVNSAPATISNYMNKQECGFERSTNSQNLVTCTYECQPLIPCYISVRFGVQVQRISWLARSQNLEKLRYTSIYVGMNLIDAD